jgi:membrane peptidoglycan carboxypeptidase
VLAHEDAGFFSHKGFSLLHIRNALARNLEAGRYVVGASTITMQLVKNVFLHREKTLARKIQEVMLTWWIERVLPKSDILELYLNVIEYGPSVYGIRHAAKHYFGRLPAQLSPAESVYLATILPNPKRYHDHYVKGGVPANWIERMRKLVVRLRERGSYDAEAAAFGLQELASFEFVREGELAKSRVIPGSAAMLPYMDRGTGIPFIDDLDSIFEPDAEPREAPLRRPTTAPQKPATKPVGNRSPAEQAWDEAAPP